MSTFARGTESVHQSAAARSAAVRRAQTERGRAASPVHRLQRRIGNQALQGVVQRQLDGPKRPTIAAPPDKDRQPEPKHNQPELKEHKKGKDKTVYSYTENDRTIWIDSYKIAFLGGSGFDTFLAAKAKKYSTFGSLFILAQATLESDFGKGNYGDDYKNMFSIMGGPPGNKGTAHGKLQKFDSYEAALEAYTSLLGTKWPATVESGKGLYLQSSFTPDEANRAFNQLDYYGRGQSYLGDKTTDYGASLFERMGFIAGPLIVLLQQKIAGIDAAMAIAGQKVHDSIAEILPFNFNLDLLTSSADLINECTRLADQKKAFQLYLAELQSARSDATTKLAAHRNRKKKPEEKKPQEKKPQEKKPQEKKPQEKKPEEKKK